MVESVRAEKGNAPRGCVWHSVTLYVHWVWKQSCAWGKGMNEELLISALFLPSNSKSCCDGSCHEAGTENDMLCQWLEPVDKQD